MMLPTNLARVAMVGLAVLLARSAFAGEVPVTFGTHGGDTWSFHKKVDVTVPARQCDHVVISSVLSTVRLPAHGGHVHTRLALQPGDNEIEAECYSHGSVRGEARQTWHVRLRNTPTASIHIFRRGSRLILDADGSTPAPVRAAAITRYQWRADDANPAALAALPASGPRIALEASAPDGDYKITLEATDAAGRSDQSTILLRSRNQMLRGVDPDHGHAAWVDGAVVYGIIPQLFGPQGLADVTAHLDQLADLGVNTIWLSPIMESPAGDFGYAVTDYFQLRRSLGSEQQLHDLIRAAHARNMHVMLDFVPNHLSDRSAYFTDTLEHGPASPYFDFFARDHTGRAEHYFDWANLENLNYANAEVQRLVIEACAHWVREFDVDGFRVDAAWGPRRRAAAFWPRWRAELKRIKPDLLLLAEASARDRYYGRHGFDAAYDWTDKLGEWAWRDAFEHEASTARRLRDAIEASQSGALVFRFLENNDTGRRFISRYGVDRTRVAAAMLLTLPGIPSLYTGQEVGAAYEPYKDARPIGWDDDDQLRAWYKRLIALRGTYTALRSADIRLLDAAVDNNVLAYVRPSATASDRILVILNYGAQPALVGLGKEFLETMRRKGIVDLLTGGEVNVGESGIEIAPLSVLVLKPN